MSKATTLLRLGSIEYQVSRSLQKKLLTTPGNFCIVCDHLPCYTYGRKTKASDWKVPEEETKAPRYKAERGGEITFHGPGQVVLYPILDLNFFKKDLRWYVRTLEQTIIDFLQPYDIEGRRDSINPGVWVGQNKIAALGIACSKWKTYHGLAINICVDLQYFDDIVACGVQERGVTSFHRLQEAPFMERATEDLLEKLPTNFDIPHWIEGHLEDYDFEIQPS